MSQQLSNEKECPFCAELVKREAVKCKHCGSDISGDGTSPQRSSTAPQIPEAALAQKPVVASNEERPPRIERSPKPGLKIGLGSGMAVVAIALVVVIGLLLAGGTFLINGKDASDLQSLVAVLENIVGIAVGEPSGDPVSETATIGKSFRIGDYGDLTFKIDSVERTLVNPKNRERAPDGVSYLVVRYGVSNDGRRPAEIDWTTKFILFTDEKDPIRFNSTTDLRGLGGELQPGFQRSNLIALFKVASEQLKKHLVLDLYGTGADHHMSFAFKDVSVSAYSTRESAQTASTETGANAQVDESTSDDDDRTKGTASEQKAETSDQQQSPNTGTIATAGTNESQTPAASTTDEHVQTEQNREQSSSLPSQANAENDAVVLIGKLLQAEHENNEAPLHEIVSRLAAIPKPVPGDTVEATRLNKIGLADLRSANYQDAATNFAAASKADPSDAKYLSNLGYAEMNIGDFDSAQKHLYSSIALAPARSVAWGNLGFVFAKKGEKDKAVASLVIGYRVSNGATMGFLKHLSTDSNNDASVREAGELALSKIPSDSSQLGSNQTESPHQ